MSALHRMTLVLFALLALTAARASAEDDAAKPASGIETMGIGKVKVNPSLLKDTADAAKSNKLGRVVEAMDSQLLDCFHNTRKFELVTRSDLDEVMKEQNFVGSGNVDTDDAMAAKAFLLKGCKYIVVTTVDNFQDFEETAHFEGIGEQGTKRVIQFSVVAKVINTTTGKIKETANFQLDNKDISRVPGFTTTKGQLNEKLLIEMARMMSDRIANRVVDVLFPAKVLAVGKGEHVVTINRGDGTLVAPGQLWDVFELGDEMIDPDTKESLGRDETRVGKVQIVSVQPKFSKAKIIEGNVVKTGDILRPATEDDAKNAEQGK